MENKHLKHIVNCKKVDTAIRRARKHLINVAREGGLYENFGAVEVRAITDNFVNISDYSKEMNEVRDKIKYFRRWANDVSLNDLIET